MTIRETIAADFAAIDVQDTQILRGLCLTEDVGAAVLEKSNALTILNDHGACMCIAGVIEVGPATASVWVILAGWAGRHMPAITKILKWAMEQNTRGYKTVETVVRSDFLNGHRWARLFGFVKVREQYCTDPDGNFEDLYRRAA